MSSLLAPIQIIQTDFVYYMSFILLISGTIGNILNCLIFIRRSLRQNSCSHYFFATSIVNMIALYFGCLTRLLNNFGIYPPASHLAFYCKIRSFLTITGLTTSTWFIVGACADRYASSSSSARIRLFSQVKIARLVIIIISIIVCLVWAQMFVCFNTSFQGVNCNPSSQICSNISDFSLLILYGLLPPILMFTFGFLTIRHINHQRIQRTVIRKDRQLTVILIVQVVCLTILSLPVAIQKIYAGFTLNQVKSQERIQLETFIATVAVFLPLTNSATPFYMFTLTSKKFRKELKYLLLFWHRRPTQIAPIPLTAQTKQTKNEYRKTDTAL